MIFFREDEDKMKIMTTMELKKIKENKWKMTEKLGRSLMKIGVEPV
jgi:hypothetical protein